MEKKAIYAIDNVDALIDFLWNEVPLGVLEEAVQKMVDEGLVKIRMADITDIWSEGKKREKGIY